jgi:CopG family transcriptional regulator, nickel-responsive regulator
MSELVRLSLSIEKPLYDRLEEMVKQSGYENRSEFIRDMIRHQLVRQQWDGNEEVVGTVTLVYDHHASNLTNKLTDLQHHHHGAVLATTHVHLDLHLCAEMILIKAKANEIKHLADLMRQQKGVLHAELSMASTGIDLT